MLLNIENFKAFLKKATLNFSIDTVHVNIEKEKIKSIMISPDSSIVILDINNNIISGIQNENTEYDLYFQDPNRQLIPFLNLVDSEEVDFFIKEDEGKVIIKSGNQKSSIFLCSPEVVSTFNRTRPREEIDSFIQINLSEISEYLDKIKKIGTRFGKIYFGVKNNNFFVETTDRESGRFTNSLKFDIFEKNERDFEICFRFKSFINVYSVLDNFDDYTFSLFIKEENNMIVGFIQIEKNDKSENYYIMSILENI